MAIAPNQAYSLLQQKRPLPPNAAYSLINATAPQDALGRYLSNQNTPAPPPNNPGGTPPAQTQALPTTNNKPTVPYAGVYLDAQNSAQKAYEDAQTQLLSQRNTLYHKYGLTDTGSVDPNNRYGDYQMLLGREGSDLDAARESAIGRGIGTGGLARQGESALRFQDGAEQLGFQNQILGVDNDYRTGLAQALSAKNSSFLQAQEDANNQALQELLVNGGYSQPNDTPTDNNAPGSTLGGMLTPGSNYNFQPTIPSNLQSWLTPAKAPPKPVTTALNKAYAKLNPPAKKKGGK